MPKITRIAGIAAGIAGIAASAAAAQEDRGVVMSEDGQLGMLEAATPIMEQVIDLHNLLLIVSAGICLLVGGLLAWVMIRYNRRKNPNPSRVSHNTPLEIIWTTVPVLILILIAVPSFRLLFAQDRVPESDMVVKVTGHQWYWTYEYPDEDGLSFDAFMLPKRLFDESTPEVEQERQQARAELADFLNREKPPEIHRLLDTDTRLVVPVDTVVKVLVTASDVIHSWTVPAFGVKMDAIPGRLNETWFKAEQTGTYYGQCSELCGIRHAYMPIAVEVVSRAEYRNWLENARAEYAETEPETPARLARAERAATGE